MTTTYDDEVTYSFNQTSSGTNNVDSTTKIIDDEEVILFSSTEQIVLTFVPMFSGLISAIGSCMTLYVIWIDRKKQQFANGTVDVSDYNTYSSSIFAMNRASRSLRRMSQMLRSSSLNVNRSRQTTESLSVYQRIMIGLSVSDLISALRISTTTFLLPSDTAGVWKAFGNTATCTFQGYFAQLGGICSLLYTTSLSVYFLLTIVSNVNAETMKRKIEPLLHAVPVLYGVSTSTIGIYFKAYNPVRFSVSCWVAPYPSMCLDDDNDIACTRGENTEKLRWIFFQVPFFLCFVIIVVCMVSIFISVRQQLRKMEFRYGSGNHRPQSNSYASTVTPTSTTETNPKSKKNKLTNRSSKRLQKVAAQSQLYIFVFFLVYFWSAVWRGLEYMHNEAHGKFFFMFLLSLVFFPLQGFFNFFIFIRPRIVQIRVINPTISWIKALRIGLGFDQEPSTAVVDKVADSNPKKLQATCAMLVRNESATQKNIDDGGTERSQDETQKLWATSNDMNEVEIFDDEIVERDASS